MDKSDYIARMQKTIQQLHNCDAVWHPSVLAHQILQGRITWEGDVEVFELTGHPEAKRCYGWSNGESEEFITILESPPVQSPQDAVKVFTGTHQVIRHTN